MGYRGARGAVAAAAWLAALAGTARGQPIVVESAVGRAPPLAAGVVPEVVKRLGFPAARAGAALAVEIDSRVGAAPRRLAAAALAELGERLERAQQDLWLSGKRVRRAIETVEDVRAQLADALGTVAHDAAARELVYRVLLTLARAYQTVERPRLAEQVMGEVVRGFPDRPVDAARDGRALAELYRRVERAQPAPAELRLDAGGAAWWYVEGRRQDGARAALPAGDYRVFAATARGDGRVHRVALAGGGGALTVDAAFEAALETADFAGFRFADTAERERSEPRFVRALAAALGADPVLVLARAGDDAVELRAYRAGAAPAAAIVDGGDPTAVGRAAAALIARAETGSQKPDNPPKTILAHSENQNIKPILDKPNSTPDRAPRWLAWAAWTGLGAGLLLAAFGGATLGWDGVGTCFAPDQLCPRQLATHALGGATVGAGGALALASTVFLLARHEPRRLRTAAIVAAAWGVALAAAGAAVLPVEDYPLSFRADPSGVVKLARATRLGGGLAIGAGAALAAAAAGLGAADLLGRRSRGLAVAPLSAAGASGFSLSCDF